MTQLCECIATFPLVVDGTTFVARRLFPSQHVIMAYEQLMSSVCRTKAGLLRLADSPKKIPLPESDHNASNSNIITFVTFLFIISIWWGGVAFHG
jgi:hypothetical protein